MKFVPNVITRGLGKQLLATKKNSPHIFFAAGVVGAGVSTFLACRATLKVEPVLDEIKQDLGVAKELKHMAITVDGNYNEREYVRDLTVIYGKSAVKLGRLYGPSLVLGGLSIASLTGAHVQLVRRNTALASTLAIVTKAFDDYRLRVQEEIGEEKEKDLYRGVREETHVVDGKRQTVKVQTGAGNLSPYARCFDAKSIHWQKNDPELNLYFLKCQERWAMERLTSRGFLFLNEVYEMLGFEPTAAGQIVGWVRPTAHQHSDGDGYIDFGIYEAHNLAFLAGTEPAIWIDFNVDGPIDGALDKI